MPGLQQQSPPLTHQTLWEIIQAGGQLVAWPPVCPSIMVSVGPPQMSTASLSVQPHKGAMGPLASPTGLGLLGNWATVSLPGPVHWVPARPTLGNGAIKVGAGLGLGSGVKARGGVGNHLLSDGAPVTWCISTAVLSNALVTAQSLPTSNAVTYLYQMVEGGVKVQQQWAMLVLLWVINGSWAWWVCPGHGHTCKCRNAPGLLLAGSTGSGLLSAHASNNGYRVGTASPPAPLTPGAVILHNVTGPVRQSQLPTACGWGWSSGQTVPAAQLVAASSARNNMASAVTKPAHTVHGRQGNCLVKQQSLIEQARRQRLAGINKLWPPARHPPSILELAIITMSQSVYRIVIGYSSIIIAYSSSYRSVITITMPFNAPPR